MSNINESDNRYKEYTLASRQKTTTGGLDSPVRNIWSATHFLARKLFVQYKKF